MRTFWTGVTVLLCCVLTLQANAQPGNAKPATSTTNPVDILIPDHCNDENIHVTGTWHIVNRAWKDAQGCVHLKGHWQLKNASAVGVTSGTNYRVVLVENWNDKEITNCSDDDCEMEEIYTYQFRLISKGSKRNRLVTITERGTFSWCADDFDIVYQFGHYQFECK